jgi:hypothetical protein
VRFIVWDERSLSGSLSGVELAGCLQQAGNAILFAQQHTEQLLEVELLGTA